MIKTILFDVDGTIIDTEYVMTHSLQKTLREELEKELPIQELHYILGIPGREAIKKFVNTEEEEDILLSKWGKNVLLLAENVRVFPHVAEILQKLHIKGIQLGIVTSKTKEEMKNEFDRFDLNQYFDIQITASDTNLHKPFPDPIQKAIDELNVKKEETIYIGDSLYDMKSAKACGVTFGLAKWGAQNIENFQNVDIVIDSPQEILDLL
ncbi:HAD family hydrolase [Enterococcus durans]|uniref:HAD family hydrolase n=1 Tax=Enterococcus durans TaxID=53345 RepID=UPI0009BFED9C|nr:HAD family hydrolase [Enterococcus durans]MBC9720004.1 HAD family hydrolase [Lactobacillus sp.]ASV96114.1 inorganic diphosphatase [Enterococcus durans]MCB8506715.1 HAD family hydrolase [Enterococcus durans]MCB8515895.1 HAD family hydrolase [Enterococcus durans]MDT2772351.1 HAD family hydrolase [Enterococcus durans]